MQARQSFTWDPRKDAINGSKHGVHFETAQRAFNDPKRVIAIDHKHSTRKERRYFCCGKIGERIITVRFILRCGVIRIFGAGFWREGRRIYDAQNRIY